MNSNQKSATTAKIIIVDDTVDNLRLLSNLLSEQGYEVRKALNGRMALTAVQAAPPDLILLDIMMPEMNGYEVCSQLKASETTREIPVIFLSALDDAFDKVKAFNVGGVDYITKPFYFEEVLARIENHLTTRRLQKQLSEQNAVLQQEIEERKQVEEALRASEAELKEALEELKRTQATLVQNEKMVSLGQLVAGIAHEINNPIGFISGNLSYVSQYTSDLLRLLKLYQNALPNPTTDIQQVLEEIDLEFFCEDLPQLMGSMNVGADRIRQIVLSLQNFSRLNEAKLKPVDIHEGLESTLMILQHRLQDESNRPAIAVVKEYGSLPLVECYAGQINQVFVNILNNAIDVLKQQEGSQENPTPTITIRTELIDPQRVAITIADNGPGMTEAVRERVFDPFFTTKQVGAGTGLGMSISYQIVVEGHGGQLRCESAPGQGAKFTIEIPLQHPQ